MPSANRAFQSDELRNAAEPLFTDVRTVRFQDIDAAGVVFFPRVLEYLHDAYMAFLKAQGFDLPRALRESQYGFPIAHAEADYLRPLTFGDAITVEIVAARVGDTSVTIGYRVRLVQNPQPVCALGQTVHVAIDRQSFRPCPLPDAFRALFSPG